MFKPGSKFIIEIETVYEDLPEKSTVEVPKMWKHLYRIKGYSSLVFDSWGLSKLTKFKDGPYGIGCVLRIPIHPKNKKELEEWREKGEFPKNPAWMVTSVDKAEDGTWTYHGIDHNGEQIEVASDQEVSYTGLHFNTVVEWANYKEEI